MRYVHTHHKLHVVDMKIRTGVRLDDIVEGIRSHTQIFIGKEFIGQLEWGDDYRGVYYSYVWDFWLQ